IRAPDHEIADLAREVLLLRLEHEVVEADARRTDAQAPRRRACLHGGHAFARVDPAERFEVAAAAPAAIGMAIARESSERRGVGIASLALVHDRLVRRQTKGLERAEDLPRRARRL